MRVAAADRAGGWTSANYAAMACVEFPLCQGNWQAELNWAQAFISLWGTPAMSSACWGTEAPDHSHRPSPGSADHGLAGGCFRPALLCQRPPERVWLVVAGSADRADCLGLANVHLALLLANAPCTQSGGRPLLACCVLARGSLSLHHDPLPSPGMVRSRDEWERAGTALRPPPGARLLSADQTKGVVAPAAPGPPGWACCWLSRHAPSGR